MTDLRKAAEMAMKILDEIGKANNAQVAPVYSGLAWSAADDLRQALAQPEQNSETYGYAKRLAEAIWEKHYKKESPHWRPLHDVLGVLTQIDNMTCGLEKAQPEQKPVAWIGNADFVKGQFVEGRVRRVWWECNTGVGQPLYTAPPKREWVGLTEEEVDAIRKEIFEKYKKALFVTRDVTSENDYSAFNFYRAIEEKLRIKND